MKFNFFDKFLEKQEYSKNELLKLKIILEGVYGELEEIEKKRREYFRMTGKIFNKKDFLEALKDKIKKLEKFQETKKIIKKIEGKIKRIENNEDLKEESELIYKEYSENLEALRKYSELFSAMKIKDKKILQRYENLNPDKFFSNAIKEFLGNKKMKLISDLYNKIKKNLID